MFRIGSNIRLCLKGNDPAGDVVYSLSGAAAKLHVLSELSLTKRECLDFLFSVKY